MTLTDAQLDIITNAARVLPLEKRNTFMERVVAQLQQRRRFNDGDVGAIAQQALTGLVQPVA